MKYFLKSSGLVLLLVGGVALIQYHSIVFWQNEIGQVGIGLSIMLEAVALFFWATQRNFLAGVATVLLLAGPMAHLGMPVYQDLQQASTQSEVGNASLSKADARIEKVQTTLGAMVQRLEEGHSGLAQHIAAQSERLDKLHAERKEMLKSSITPLAWEDYLPVGMYALALLLLQLSNIFAIRALSSEPAQNIELPEEHAFIDEDNVVNINTAKQKDEDWVHQLMAKANGGVPR